MGGTSLRDGMVCGTAKRITVVGAGVSLAVRGMSQDDGRVLLKYFEELLRLEAVSTRDQQHLDFVLRLSGAGGTVFGSPGDGIARHVGQATGLARQPDDLDLHADARLRDADGSDQGP